MEKIIKFSFIVLVGALVGIAVFGFGGTASAQQGPYRYLAAIPGCTSWGCGTASEIKASLYGGNSLFSNRYPGENYIAYDNPYRSGLEGIYEYSAGVPRYSRMLNYFDLGRSSQMYPFRILILDRMGRIIFEYPPPNLSVFSNYYSSYNYPMY